MPVVDLIEGLARFSFADVQIVLKREVALRSFLLCACLFIFYVLCVFYTSLCHKPKWYCG